MNKNKYPYPDENGYFGEFGGCFVPETLLYAVRDLAKIYGKFSKNKVFLKELKNYYRDFAGRPTPLYLSGALSSLVGGRVYLKREDLLHTGAHKINNALGQALLARETGKKRIIAETGAGQHGVAVASVSALFSLKCDIYMGSVDIERQKKNVERMKLLKARVLEVDKGEKTLKEAVSEALRDWITNHKNTYYLIGSAVGPHPYPMIVRDFQKIIGEETRQQILKLENKLPDYLLACVGGGSNAIGMFYPFYFDKKVKMLGIEAGGTGKGKNAASLTYGRTGILHGSKSYLLQDRDGQVLNTESISAGLDYPATGPEHAFYKASGRAEYHPAGDETALEGFFFLTEKEGIIPALESSHAIGYLMRNRKRFRNKLTVICLSGRGDKDLDIIQNRKWQK